MKKQDIQKLVLESVREVVKEDNINLDEIDFGGIFKYTPPTDEQIDAYLRSRPKDKATLDKDPERKEKFIEFVKKDKAAGKAIKAKEVVFATYDPKTKEYKGASGTKSLSATSFGETKVDEISFLGIDNAVNKLNDPKKYTKEDMKRAFDAGMSAATGPSPSDASFEKWAKKNLK